MTLQFLECNNNHQLIYNQPLTIENIRKQQINNFLILEENNKNNIYQMTNLLLNHIGNTTNKTKINEIVINKNLYNFTYDFIQREEIKDINSYLQDKDNIIFYEKNTTHSFVSNKTFLNLDNNNIFYECYNTDTLKLDNINKKIQLFNLRNISSLSYYIPIYLMHLIKYGKKQEFIIMNSGIKLNSVISYSALNGNTSLVSASHCQTGQDGLVAIIVPIY
jgi:hypothetical protein